MGENGIASGISNISEIRVLLNLNTPPHLLQNLIGSVLDNRYKILKTHLNIPIGYLAWMNINEDTLSLCNNKNCLPRYSYEHNDGNILLLHDVTYLPHWQIIAREMIFDFLQNHNAAYYFKRGKLRKIRSLDRLKRFKSVRPMEAR